MEADYKRSKEEAYKILKENFVSSPPVVIEEIARNYGLNIYGMDFNGNNDVSGFIDPEKKAIYVNKDESETRKAFTIAHELGHWILHPHKLKESPDKYAILFRRPIGSDENDPTEQEANCFAAHILVPKYLLNDYKSENDNVIADIFGVSAELIGYRKQREYGGNI
jgi:Zn-dependent peptidase ImmA (M78 family)